MFGFRDAAHTTCITILNAALLITEPPVLSATVASANVTCFDADDATILITSPAGGYGTYGYSIDGGTTWQASGSFANLAPGSYNLQIRDAANPLCVITLNAALLITEPPVLSATVASANVTCFDADDATITITSPAGGYGTYGYSIDGGTTWQASGSFANLAPGSYNVQIRDAANPLCVITLNAALLITEPPVLSATVASANVTCFDADDATITITSPAGGYGTYGYSIDGGTTWQASGSFANLAPGSYNVQIRDAANPLCVITLNAALLITEPPVLSATVASANVTCFDADDATITITSPAGGYGTYGYSVDGGTTWQASGSFANLAPGSYNLQIRDAANPLCVITLNAALLITEPPVLSATVASANVTCFDADDATITITSPAGGYGTYGYSIDGGTTWQASR